MIALNLSFPPLSLGAVFLRGFLLYNTNVNLNLLNDVVHSYHCPMVLDVFLIIFLLL